MLQLYLTHHLLWQCVVTPTQVVSNVEIALNTPFIMAVCCYPTQVLSNVTIALNTPFIMVMCCDPNTSGK